MIDKSRRSFLKLSALGLTAAATAEVSFAISNFADSLQSSTANVRVTSGQMRYAEAPPLTWKTSNLAGANRILVDPARKFQQILGFGVAFTDAACYNVNKLSAPAREQLFHELFHPSQMALNVCRSCIGASDYSRKIYSYDDGRRDPDLKRFSIKHDEAYILPALRLARKENPDLFLFSSPWSPPAWMKEGGSMRGGSMRQRFFAPYAQYLYKFLQAYAAAGVPVQAITVQNEVDTDQDGRMPACIWPQEYEIGFVKNHLGPLFEKNGVKTQIWILDHNYNLWGRAVAELDDSELRKYCNSVAFHGYVGTPDMMTRLHDAHPDAHIYWTEGGPDLKSPEYQTEWVRWGHIYTGVLRNWAEALTAWNLALDENGQPNLGPFLGAGFVTIDSKTKEITRSGQYWGVAHFSRAIRRGARRIDSQGQIDAVEHVAFENPGGEKVIVITNAGSEKKITLACGEQTADLNLAATSLTTITWT